MGATVSLSHWTGPDPKADHQYSLSDYDTSDKARIPAYTDRILWKGNNVSLRAVYRIISQRLTCSFSMIA